MSEITKLEEIIQSGDRVEFKRYIAAATDSELTNAWIKGRKFRVQDFGDLAWDELMRRREGQ